MTGRRLAAAAGVLAVLSGGCATARPSAVPEAEAARVRELWERAREEAWGQRRFKALFRGESVPRAGAVVRGYLSVFWDGETLEWRLSAPLAGGVRQGLLSRSGASPGAVPLPARVSERDAIGVLLGVLDVPAAGAEVLRDGESHLLDLGGGRAGRLDSAGRVVELRLGSDASVRLDPGPALPRRLEAVGPEGRVVLALESFGPWEEVRSDPGGG
ncbi:hypothetical protein FBQ97_08775 [Acidobacteria bacterium ACD]|nr:MAG: hypothetical protein EDX89_19700 [Acidobacteriota bacterium]MDL1949889.1 hypothetical protein [Acidobacteria bacterium ACD]